MPQSARGRYGLIYLALMAVLTLHLVPGFGIATYLIVTGALAWLYRTRARETGQTKSAAAAMALWLVFGFALLLAINGHSMGPADRRGAGEYNARSTVRREKIVVMVYDQTFYGLSNSSRLIIRAHCRQWRSNCLSISRL